MSVPPPLEGFIRELIVSPWLPDDTAILVDEAALLGPLATSSFLGALDAIRPSRHVLTAADLERVMMEAATATYRPQPLIVSSLTARRLRRHPYLEATRQRGPWRGRRARQRAAVAALWAWEREHPAPRGRRVA